MEQGWSGKKLLLFWSVLIAVLIGAICFSHSSNHEVIQGSPKKEIPESLRITEEDLQEFCFPAGTSDQYIDGYFTGYDIGKYDGYYDCYENSFGMGYDESCDGYGDYERGYLQGYDEGYCDGCEAGEFDKDRNYPYNPSP